ncbi:MAG: LLM class flavin-dependent oxidoreductase [Beijerinckiaceae bacterium]
MQVGLFDHVAHSGRSVSSLFKERLAFYQAADKADFYCVHLAEHHCSPVNMTPIPGVFLGALANATRRIHLGTLVYLLTLVSPLRMAEEICILDQLSDGRMETGVGRGISPYELAYHKIAHEDSRDIFLDAYACLRQALTHEVFSYEGRHFSYKDVPMPNRPLQQPFPPFWYGSSNKIGSTFAGEQGMHFTANGPSSQVRTNIATFREALAKRGGPECPKPEFSGGTAVGALRYIVVAETDDKANAIAEPAVMHHLGSLHWLWKKHGHTEFADRLRIPDGVTYKDLVDDGVMIAGSPSTVLDKIGAQARDLDFNYLLGYMIFGDMPVEAALASQAIFQAEVMPHVKAM